MPPARRCGRPGKERANKLESEWREGLWLGHSRRSNEAIIGTREGVRAHAVKLMDEESRWDAKYLQEMKGTPQQPDPLRPGLAILIKVNIDPPHEESPAPAEGAVDECDRQIRRMRITGVMLQKYGYTEGCDGCRLQTTRRNARGTSTHRGMPQEDRGGDDGRRDGPPQGGGG